MVKNKFGVPCSGLKEFIKDVDVHCPSEECAMAIAAGCALCGENATVYLQNSGLFRCGDIILSLFHPYRIELPKLLLSIRHKPEHHKLVGSKTREFLKLLDYPMDKIEIIEQEE